MMNSLIKLCSLLLLLQVLPTHADQTDPRPGRFVCAIADH